MMRLRQVLILPICFATFSSCAQPDSSATIPNEQQFVYKLGTTKITLSKSSFGASTTPFFIQLHDNEKTAKTAAKTFLQQHGGTLLAIQNKDRRYITFKAANRKHLFDPNRMFTAKGTRKNLHLLGTYTSNLAALILGFRNFLLQLVPDSTLVIAVHNNTDNNYSIHSYLSNGVLKKDAAQVHINPAQDGDDFFITTDDGVFKKLAAADYNCVLHNNRTQNDDGSLGFYFGRQNRPYVNVEAQAGHLEEQIEMLQVLHQVLQPGSL